MFDLYQNSRENNGVINNVRNYKYLYINNMQYLHGNRRKQAKGHNIQEFS